MRLKGRGSFQLSLLLFILQACASKNENVTAPRKVQDSSEMQIAQPYTSADSLPYPMKEGNYLIEWKVLSKVQFEMKEDTTTNTMVPYPIFDESIRKLAGQPIEIKGYIIPDTETDGNLHVLSAFPYSSCFFCGGLDLKP